MDAQTRVRGRSTSALAAALLLATGGCCLDNPDWEDFEPVDLGVSAKLNAVTISDADSITYLAVGDEGTFVAWTDKNPDRTLEVERSTVPGGADLRDVVSHEGSYWVVGDGGLLAVSDDEGATWTSVDLATNEDLHAITAVRFDRMIVVGDELLRVREADGAWVEPPPPAEGWGRLRAVYVDSLGERAWAVGLDGVVRFAEDASGQWSSEPSGTQADLFVVDSVYFGGDGHRQVALGAAGTMTVRDEDSGEWSPISTGVGDDFIAHQSSYFLTAGGEVLDMEFSGRGDWQLETLDGFPGARAMFVEQFFEGARITVVGEGGRAAVKDSVPCPYGKV